MLKGLQDHSSYVKKAAVIGCLQLYKLAPHELNGKFIAFLFPRSICIRP